MRYRIQCQPAQQGRSGIATSIGHPAVRHLVQDNAQHQRDKGNGQAFDDRDYIGIKHTLYAREKGLTRFLSGIVTVMAKLG